jgi:hypothetical protein
MPWRYLKHFLLRPEEVRFHLCYLFLAANGVSIEITSMSSK